MFTLSLGYWELGNLESREEPLPASALRLKTARGFKRGDRLLLVACQVSALALDMTEDALRDASTYARR